ncbi:alpha/beta hydrolase [Nonomuraea sp. NPDC049152]|uniref:alpha/beta fold hydrolase n=1 Tax=Nonomuraea sp. NPDC049152 TaxID=3154350 RepID=UPI0033DB632F
MTNHTMRVPGAEIYYEVRGQGPVLLLGQSGEGDADRGKDLADRLVADFTVVTYDRRGLSRSTLDDPAVTMAVHADDVRRLLAEVTDEPAAMLGCSFGAALGLHVAARYPGLLHTLIAHEPVAPWLLPDAARELHVRELAEVQEVFEREGLAPAIKQVAEILGIDPHSTDKEPGLSAFPMTPQRVANFAFFLRHDLTAIREDMLDPEAVRATSTRIVPVAGRTTPRGVFDYLCAVELAGLVGAELEELPGGHNGNLTHPRAYADGIRRLLG